MADTVAVMNDGRDRAARRARPSSTRTRATTFVANFLGQSNLVGGEVDRRRAATCSTSTSTGAARSRPRRRLARAAAATCWSGYARRRSASRRRRPRPTTARNVLAGGVVTDVSFVGVSTQYLVRHALGPGADGLRAEHRSPDRFRGRRPGRPALAARAHLPARRRPGRRRRVRTWARTDGDRRPRAGPAEPPPSGRGSGRKRGWTGYLLLLPGRAVAAGSSSSSRWSRWSAPASTTRPARSTTGYDADRALVATTRDALEDYGGTFLRSLLYAGRRDGRRACCSASRWPTRSPSRPAAGRT